MAQKAGKKKVGKVKSNKKAAAGAGGMPTGAMTKPPKNAKARAMPAGKMT